MANIRISQLPTAPDAITGAELVPIVQNGQTVQTTITDIVSSPSQTQTFITVNAESSLPNSRYIGGGLGIGTSDAGAQGLFSFFLDGTSASLENASTGIIVKSGVDTVVNRLIASGTAGLSVANGNGISGNPTLSLTGLALSAATLTGNGMVSLVGGSYFQNVTLTGTADQISIANPNGGSNPTFSIADNPIIPGTSFIQIPSGTTGERPLLPSNGELRYNTTTGTFEGYANGAWGSITTGTGVTSVGTGTGLTGGPITSTGTISIANTAVTAGSYGSATQVGTFTVNAQGQLTAAANVTITAGGIGAVESVSGTANEITATGTTNVTLSLPTALTFTGKTVTGGTLTGVAINGSTNTLSNIANSSLTNSSITLGTTNIALGGTSLAPAGLSSVTVTGDPTLALQLATKQYVDGLVATGLTYHEPVQAATPASLASTTGGTVTYNAPGPEGVGATITLSVALTVLDGYTLLNTNRVLIKNEVNQAYNGVYTWATGGTVLTRATDADTYGTGVNQLSQNDYFFTQNGTVNKGTSYVCTSVGLINFTTTPITFAEFSSSLVYTGGTGITVSGTVISISNTAVTAGSYGSATEVGTFTVNAQGQLTLAGNTTVTPAVGSITGLGTGVATALAVNTGSAGAFVVNGGALGTPSSGTVTNLTGTASININGTVGASTANTGAFTTLSATGQISSTATGSATTGAGQIYLNGATSNRIDWASVGTGAPAFTTRSAGTKLLLYPALSGSQVDYAIGIDAATLWSSVPSYDPSFSFKWYGAETQVASLTGTGAFTAIGGISGGTF